jgi:polar amino acid transport system substrate-binding protein
MSRVLLWSKRRVGVAALAVCLGVGAAACGADDGGGATGGTTPEPTGQQTGATGGTGEPTGAGSLSAPSGLIREGQFSVCTDPTYPPLEYFDENGEFVGFDVAVARAVAERWGLEARFVETAFSGLLPALDAGRCDVAWSGLFIDEERTATFGAVPYQETTSVILVQAGNPSGISSPEDLSGKTVTSQNGTNLLKLAQQISDDLAAQGEEPANVQGYDKFDQAIQQLVVGRADAVITQDIDAAFRELAQPGQFEVAYRFPDAETFGVYYRPDNAELGTKLHEVLVQLEQEGELARLAEQEGMPADGIAVQEPIGP